jgi:hypothetical protein
MCTLIHARPPVGGRNKECWSLCPCAITCTCKQIIVQRRRSARRVKEGVCAKAYLLLQVHENGGSDARVAAGKEGVGD